MERAWLSYGSRARFQIGCNYKLFIRQENVIEYPCIGQQGGTSELTDYKTKMNSNRPGSAGKSRNRLLRFGNTADFASVVLRSRDVLKYQDTDISVYRAIVDGNRQHMEDAALIFMGRRITYRELIAQADRVSSILTSMNIRKGDIILLGANSPQAVSILLACSRIGASVMILTTRTGPEQFAQTIADMDIPMMFCTSDVYTYFAESNAVDELAHVVILPLDCPIGEDTSTAEFDEGTSNVTHWDAFLNHKITETAEEVYGGYFPLTISASTGTTGAPKGIVIENKSFIALEKVLRRAGFCWNRGDILSATLSTGVVSGTSMFLLVPLMMGLTVLQSPRYPNVNPFASYLEDAAFYKANILCAPPSLWIAMINAHPGEVDLSGVKQVYTVGEAITAAEYDIINGFLQANHVSDRLRNMYGMSEINSMATYAVDTQRSPVSAGVAVPYSTIVICDHDTLRELPFGKVGEVFIHTPTAMKEYLYDPKETKELFVRDEFGEKWVRTGDLGILERSGELYLLGRISQRFEAPDGSHIYPYMLEAILLKMPEVSRMKMVNILDDGSPAYAIHVIPKGLSEAPQHLAEKIFAALSKNDAIPFLPRFIKIRDSFPRNPGGKVDMQKLAMETDGFISNNSKEN